MTILPAFVGKASKLFKTLVRKYSKLHWKLHTSQLYDTFASAGFTLHYSANDKIIYSCMALKGMLSQQPAPIQIKHLLKHPGGTGRQQEINFY